MRVAVLTSVNTRHRYFANALRKGLPVVAVVYEETGYNPAVAATDDLTSAERAVVDQHFAERTRQEEVFFGAGAAFVEDGQSCAVQRTGVGTLNSQHTLRFLTGLEVDTVVVYGTNLIKPPLLGQWPGRMINMHLGLSPYYRGTATNFYPLVNEEPQYVGATIHFIDQGIDSGAILRHARPRIVADDMPHTIGCKAIQAGIDAMMDVLTAIERGVEVESVPQWDVPHARLYLRKDYHPCQVVDLYRKIKGGLIRNYAQRAAADELPSFRLVT